MVSMIISESCVVIYQFFFLFLFFDGAYGPRRIFTSFFTHNFQLFANIFIATRQGSINANHLFVELVEIEVLHCSM